jgi:hypothetical protein
MNTSIAQIYDNSGEMDYVRDPLAQKRHQATEWRNEGISPTSIYRAVELSRSGQEAEARTLLGMG